MKDITIDVIDEPTTPRREFSLSEREFKVYKDAGNALDKANEGRFDGSCERNDEIMTGLATIFTRKLPGCKGPERLIPKDPEEPLQVMAVLVRENVEVYWMYLKLGTSCEKVQITESKGADFYDVFKAPSWTK